MLDQIGIWSGPAGPLCCSLQADPTARDIALCLKLFGSVLKGNIFTTAVSSTTASAQVMALGHLYHLSSFLTALILHALFGLLCHFSDWAWSGLTQLSTLFHHMNWYRQAVLKRALRLTIVFTSSATEGKAELIKQTEDQFSFFLFIKGSDYFLSVLMKAVCARSLKYNAVTYFFYKQLPVKIRETIPWRPLFCLLKLNMVDEMSHEGICVN